MKALAPVTMALAVLAFALPSGAENLVLTQADALCIANQAAPDRVFAAAEAAGWKPMPNEPGGILDLFNMVPNPAIRLKDFDGRPLMLKAREDIQSLPVGTVRRRICSVAKDAPASPDLVEAIRARFGVPPTVVEGPVSSWAWVDTPAGKQFLAGQDNDSVVRALADYTVYILAVSNEGQLSMVIFYEVSRATQ